MQELIFIKYPYQSALACLVPAVFVLVALKSGHLRKDRLIKIAGWTGAVLVITFVAIFAFGIVVAIFSDGPQC